MLRWLLLLIVLAPSAAQAQLHLPVRAAEIANLTYQLDCVSGVSRSCLAERFEGLWRERFLTTAEDSARLDQWRGVRQRYAGQIELSTGETLGLSAKVRTAGLQASGAEDYRDRLGLLMSVTDLIRTETVIQQFLPAFSEWWDESAAAQGEAYTRDMTQSIHKHRIGDWMDRFAAFYQSELPAGYRLPVSLIVRPPSEVRSTSAFMNDDQAVVEMMPGVPPEAMLDVVVHEAAHFLYSTASPDERNGTVTWFLSYEREKPGAIAAYQLLDEAVATALGNGLVREAIVADSAAWAAFAATPLSFYNDPEIDVVAKAILPWIGEWIERGGTLYSNEFRERYLASVRDALGEPLARPAAYMRHLTLLVDDHFNASVRDAALGHFRANHFSASQEACCTEGWAEALRDAPASGGIVVVPWGKVKPLAEAGVISEEDRLMLHAPARGGAVLYGTQRASGAPLYILVAGSDEQAVAAMDRLAAMTVPLVGLAP